MLRSSRINLTRLRSFAGLLGACGAAALVAAHAATASPGARTSTATPSAQDQSRGLAGTEPWDAGLYVHYCPSGPRERAVLTPSPEAAPPSSPEPGTAPEASPPSGTEPAPSQPKARAAGTSEAGWPAKGCLKMDKGPAGRRHTLVGLNGVHNWLLGGYGSDTVLGGNHGDVIWGDYHPSGEPRSQTLIVRAGNGRNVIYANDTYDYVWTGTNPRTVVHAHAAGISGVIHCQSPGIVVFLSTISEKHFTLHGCTHVSHYSVGY